MRKILLRFYTGAYSNNLQKMKVIIICAKTLRNGVFTLHHQIKQTKILKDRF